MYQPSSYIGYGLSRKWRRFLVSTNLVWKEYLETLLDY